MSHTEEFNKIKIEREKLLLLDDHLGWNKARELAVENKAKVFCNLMTILKKPNPDDIEILYEERRFESFWHVIGTSNFEYRKKNKYCVPVNPEVEDLDLLGANFIVDKANNCFLIESIEHCKEDYREELMIDANTDKPDNFVKYLRYPYRQILSTEELTQDGTPIADIETRASTLVRQVLQSLVKPIKADKILNENITIHDLNLYFYPIYTFEYYWKTKDKKATVSYDGVTGDVDFKASKISDKLSKNFTSDEIFEFSKEIAGSLIPGGGLAMMVGRKIVDISKNK